MGNSRPCMARSATTLGLLTALLVMAAPAPTPVTVQDRFNNNVINPVLWEVRQFGGVFVEEEDERLEIRANGQTGNLSFGSIEVRPWGIDWRYPAVLSADYRLYLPQPSGNNIAGVGFVFTIAGTYPTTFTGITAGVQREVSGLYLVIGRYHHGQSVGGQRSEITDNAGTITVDWNRSLDRVRISAANKTINYFGLWDQYGDQYGTQPMLIGLGGVTSKGDFSFSGHRAWLDNFRFDGVKRSR